MGTRPGLLKWEFILCLLHVIQGINPEAGKKISHYITAGLLGPHQGTKHEQGLARRMLAKSDLFVLRYMGFYHNRKKAGAIVVPWFNPAWTSESWRI